METEIFFVASKVLSVFFEPVNFLVIVGFAGLFLTLTRYRRAGTRIAVAAALLFACACFLPLGSLLLRPLEDRFPKPALSDAPTGIIVLGGSIDPDISQSRGEPAVTQAAGRLTAGVELARRYPEAKLVFTGGSSNIRQTGHGEAAGVRDLWLGLGMPPERLLFEGKSRNTVENATMTKVLVQPKPTDIWLLVTSASHLPRSVGIFRRAGWPVVPYPVDYRTFGDDRDYRLTSDSLQNLARLHLAFHEWIGLVAYRLTGKSDALFPAP